jgi:hypothetical protein
MKNRFIITEMPSGYCVRWAHNNRAVRRCVINQFNNEKMECYVDAVNFINEFDYVLDKFELAKVKLNDNPVIEAPKYEKVF